MSCLYNTALALLVLALPVLLVSLVWSAASRSAVLGFLELGLRKVRVLFHPRPAVAWIAWARTAHHGFMARAFIEEAVRTGDPEGLLEQGLLLWEGGLGAAGREGAVKWFRQAAERGQPDAMYWLAEAFGWGAAGAPDRTAALAWLRRGAVAGSGACMAKLAAELRTTLAPADAEEAQAWDAKRFAAGTDPEPRHSAALGGRGEAEGAAARGRGAELDERLEAWFAGKSKQVWFQGLFWLLFVLAILLALLTFVVAPAWIIYTFGSSLATPGADRTAPLWLPAGLGLAILLMLSWIWREARSPKRELAVHRLMTRAEAGDQQAAHDLAQAYRRGARGLALDALAARVWFARAAEAGHAPSMLLLAEMLRCGEGGLRDEEKARVWLERSSKTSPRGAGAP